MAGFSLVEVVLAIGIVAFAFLPLLGLMPIGLNTSRQAIDTTMEAQIVQQMTSLAQQTDFSNLPTMVKNPLVTTPASNLVYFDGNGNITTAASAMYKASFSAPTSTVLPGGATTSNLNTITIYILSTHTLNGMSTTDLSTNTASKKYIVFVANNGL